VRLLYKKTLKRRDLTFADLVFPKIPRKLPVVMSPEEVTRRIESAPYLMHRTILMVLYGTGIRRTEAARLKVSDIDAVRRLPHRNLAMELQKLLNDEVRSRSRQNLVLSRSFAERLEETIRRYPSRTIESAQVIAEMIELAKTMRQAHRRGEKLRRNEEELAFCDALEVNDSAVKITGDEILRNIARELVETVRRNTTIDWTVKESVRAKLRTMVKRILRKCGYPPDKQEKATVTVLEQAELLGKDWAAQMCQARRLSKVLGIYVTKVPTVGLVELERNCCNLLKTNGSGGEDRTPDLGIMRPSLYH